MVDDLSIAKGLLDQRRWDDALPVLTDVLTAEPDSVRGWCLLAVCHDGRGDGPAMLTAADRAVTVAPGDDSAHQLQALALQRTGRLDQAVQAARRGYAIAPTSSVARVTLAEVLIARNGQGDLAQAYRLAREVVELAGDLAGGWATWGRVLAAAGDERGAYRAHRRALELDPALPGALNNVASGLITRFRLISALRLLRQAWRHDPGHPVYRRNLTLLGFRAALGVATLGAVLCLVALGGITGRWPWPAGAGLAAAAGFGLAVGFWGRLLAIEPRLLVLASGRAAVVTRVLVIAVPIQVATLALTALQRPVVDGHRSLVLLGSGLVLLVLVEFLIGRGARWTSRRRRWLRLRRSLEGDPHTGQPA